jgi:cytochrome c5
MSEQTAVEIVVAATDTAIATTAAPVKKEKEIEKEEWHGSDENGGDGYDTSYVTCGVCGKRNAEIFQITGDYCLECWQESTSPRI